VRIASSRRSPQPLHASETAASRTHMLGATDTSE
jgi:hypothetical protein